MSCNAKEIYLQMEGDAYFERNLKAQKANGITMGAKLFYDFILRQIRGAM